MLGLQKTVIHLGVKLFKTLDPLELIRMLPAMSLATACGKLDFFRFDFSGESCTYTGI